MYKIEPKDYHSFIQHIEKMSCGAVYPFSIAKGIQRGNIYSDKSAFLYWHYSGFAFLYGKYDERSLGFVSSLLLDSTGANSRRFILFTADNSVERFFRKAGNVAVERRLFFEYGKDRPTSDRALPAGYSLYEIDDELLARLNGNITPYFSWDNSGDFLEKGKGCCIVEGNNIASWAFSAAVSSEEIDIGIETAAVYRHLGLAAIVAEKMIQYCLDQHKRPVWACHADNIASRKLAEKLGFAKVSEYMTIKRADG